jgi:DnaD/phage-associated family protein
MAFKGFPEGKNRLVPVPGLFFQELLPQIDHLGELKLTLYLFWRLDRMEGTFRYLRKADLLEDDKFLRSMGSDLPRSTANIEESLDRAVLRGTLLRAELPPTVEGPQELYFLNSPKGRAAVKAIAQGQWRFTGDELQPVIVREDVPNIFRLYEEHIGPLTPMIAEDLREAEESYPPEWIEDSIRMAVENNVRNWRYINAILVRWREKGRDERKNRRDTEKDRRRYAEWEDI